VSFLQTMAEELGARRRRLQKALGALAGGLIEFAVLGGLTVGVAGAFLGKYLGVLPLLGFVIGYVWLERRRQAALAAGAEPDVLRRRSDLQALVLSVAMALLGFMIFGLAMQAKQQAGWTPPEPKVIDLEIAK
jgi:hypothetical protein